MPVAVGGLLLGGFLFGLAWHRGVGECNVTAAGSDTNGLLRAVLVIAIADLALCIPAWRQSKGMDRPSWLLVTGLTCTALGAATVVLLVGVNFRGC